MPLFIGVFLCFPSRAGVYACAREREGQGSRARSARALAAEMAQRWGRWRGRSGRPLAPSLSLVSLALLPSLLAPLPVGFCSRPSRLGGSAGLAFQVPRLVSAIPPRVSQSVAGVFRPSGRAFAAAHRPSLFGFCLCAVPCAELLCGGAAAVGPRAQGARLWHAPWRPPLWRPLACAMRPRPRLAPDGACALLRRAQGLHWRNLRFSKNHMNLS